MKFDPFNVACFSTLLSSTFVNITCMIKFLSAGLCRAQRSGLTSSCKGQTINLLFLHSEEEEDSIKSKAGWWVLIVSCVWWHFKTFTNSSLNNNNNVIPVEDHIDKCQIIFNLSLNCISWWHLVSINPPLSN